ncbi:MAG: T9SS type A sorting domain-containing protein [Bacteroidales bacterium]|jgi:hypothetical protein|nr:T9SS type A sorting domain-containing protein [Bacteroidales bacterium]
MKKLVLFIASVAFGLGIQAQSFRLTTPEGTEIGSEVTFLLRPSDQGFKQEYIYMENLTQEPIAVRMQIEKLDMSEGSDIVMCFAGNCLLDTIAPVTNIATIEAGERYEEFDLQYTYSDMRTPSTVKVNLLNPADLTIIQSFIIHYSDTESGLGEITENRQASVNIYPNPVTTTTCIKYIMPKDCQSPSIIVKNMLGKEVKNVKISGSQSGKVYINTEDLSQGLYFCSIVCDNQTIATKKIVVKH